MAYLEHEHSTALRACCLLALKAAVEEAPKGGIDNTRRARPGQLPYC